MKRPVEYTVFIKAPQTQTIWITMRVRNVESPTLDFALPVWRQGRYAVINPAGTIHSVRVDNGSGHPLPFHKIDKTTWRATTEGSSEILVTYSLYANSLSDRTRHVDDTHAFLSGSTVFLYAPERRGDPISVRLETPESWKVSSGLKHATGDPRLLLAPNYDVLIDSPIETGLHETVCFELDGKPHDIMIWGEPRYDPEQLKRDFAAIVKTEVAIFGELPYDRYVFMIHVAPGLGGGTEHLNSTIMQMPARAFEDPQQYKRLLSLAAHEMFHTWNVKRLRPAALRSPDLSKENYTDLLWFVEGTTAYYDELIVVRAGLETPEAYLQSLAEAIYQMRARPGSRVQSLAESSFDAWIKFNQPSADDVNSTVSFYDNGALASLLLDLELRKRTKNLVSLDTLIGEMYRRFPVTGPGFTTDEMIETANRLSDSGFDSFFARFIRGTDPYPFEEVFLTVGLQMVVNQDAPKAYLGLILQDQNGRTVVRSVLSDSPAYLAGVNPGDQIVTVNGEDFGATDLIAHVDRNLKPGDLVRVEIMRRNRERTMEFELGTKPSPRWQFVKVPSPTAEQESTYRSWLGQTS